MIGDQVMKKLATQREVGENEGGEDRNSRIPLCSDDMKSQRRPIFSSCACHAIKGID